MPYQPYYMLSKVKSKVSKPPKTYQSVSKHMLQVNNYIFFQLLTLSADKQSSITKVAAYQRLSLFLLSSFSVLSFFELDLFKCHFRIPGEILSEILVRTIFCYLVRFLGSLNNQKWFAPKFHSKFRQKFKFGVLKI